MRRRLNPSNEQLLTNNITSTSHLTTLNIVRSTASDEPPVAVSKTAGEQQPVTKLIERGLELTQLSASAYCTQPTIAAQCSSEAALSSAHEDNNTETTLSQDNSFGQLDESSSPVTCNSSLRLEDQSSSADHHQKLALGNSHGLRAGD